MDNQVKISGDEARELTKRVDVLDQEKILYIQIITKIILKII